MVKKLFLPLLVCSLFFVACTCSGTSYNDEYARPVYLFPGVGLGTVVAVVVSWSRNKSILWAIVHGILGWLYVIYALLVRNKN